MHNITKNYNQLLILLLLNNQKRQSQKWTIVLLDIFDWIEVEAGKWHTFGPKRTKPFIAKTQSFLSNNLSTLLSYCSILQFMYYQMTTDDIIIPYVIILLPVERNYY